MSMSAEIQLEWYIDPVAPSVIAPRVHGLTYNSSAQSAVAVAGSAEGGTMQYSLNGTTWSTAFPTVTNVGNYTLYYRVIGDKNHTDLPAAGLSFNVAALAPVVTPPTARTLTYNSAAQYLVTAGSTTGGTMKYKLGEDGTWSTTRPQGTNAGDYTVYWYVDGGGSYADVDGGAIAVTIAKAEQSATVVMPGYTYAGTLLTPTVTNKVGDGAVTYYYATSASGAGVPWANVSSSTYLDVQDYYIYAMIDGTTNYEPATTSRVKFTVAKASSSVTLSTYTLFIDAGSTNTITVTFTGSPGTRRVSSNNTSVATATLIGNTVTINGIVAGSAAITVSVEGSDNYEPASATIAVSVVTLPFVEATAAGYSGVYDKAAHGITVTVMKPASGFTIYYSTDNSTWTTTKPTYTNVADTPKTVYWKVTASGYQDATGSETVTIGKATPTLVLNPANIALDSENIRGVINITYDGDGALSAESSNPEVVGVALSGMTAIVSIESPVASATGYEGAYDRNPHSITINVTSPANYTIYYRTNESEPWDTENPTFTNAMETVQTVYWKVTAAGYADITGSATVNITKATPTLTLNPTKIILNSDNPSANINITYNGDGALSAESSDPAAVGVSIADRTVTVTMIEE